jgi:hypothetical protein
MNKKNLAIAIGLVGLSSYAVDYNVLVTSEHNKYEVVDNLPPKWVDSGAPYNCSYAPLKADYYELVQFEETESCDQDQTRTNNGVVENRTIQTETKSQVYGSHEAKSCLDIINHNGDIGDGSYQLTVNSEKFYTHCDMTNGGLTLALHIKNSGQLNGGTRDSFWSDGADLSASYNVTSFTGLDINSLGFLGWNRIDLMKNSSTLEVNVRGTNTLGESINENYNLYNFAPNMSNTVIEQGNMDQGIYSIARQGDTNPRNNWGTCGSQDSGYKHIGLGLCVNGFNGASPNGRVVQIWHYHDYDRTMNVSFGSPTSNTNISYNNSNSYDFYLYIK